MKTTKDIRNTFLKLLRQREDAATLRLAEAHADVQKARERIEQLQRQLTLEDRRARDLLRSGNAAPGLAEYRRRVADLAGAFERQTRGLSELVGELHRSRDAVRGAMQRRKSFEVALDRSDLRREARLRGAAVGDLDDLYQAHGAWKSEVDG